MHAYAMAHTLSRQALTKLQSKPEGIRNMCILAHVDHGKTTLSDSLLSSNGIISSKLAGKVRYLDSTEEEQARGITMKASAIALVHYDEPFRELRRKDRLDADGPGAQGNVVGETSGSPDISAPADGTTAVPSTRLPYLINLIDSPGHVDFSMDVAAAARLCDGALVIVDAVEGVCIQTHAVLRTAWAEGVRPALILNKVDRLITELRLTPSEAYGHLSRIIEAANVIMSSLYTADLMAAKHGTMAGDGVGSAAEARAAAATAALAGPCIDDSGERELALSVDSDTGGNEARVVATDTWAIEVDEKAEAALFFDPCRGNIVFASAYDGWAFSVDDFARLHAPRLSLQPALLRRALWGNYVYKAKSKKVVTGSGSPKPLAVSLMLEPLWAVYDACVLNPHEERVAKIVKGLGLEGSPKLGKRDMSSKDGSVRAQTILKAWLPLSSCVLGMVVRTLPSPKEAQRKRLHKLWPVLEHAVGVREGGPLPPLTSDMTLAQRLARVRAGIEACDNSPEADTVLFVSKMFAVPKNQIPSLDAAFEGQGARAGAAFPTAMLPLPSSAWCGMNVACIGDPPGSGLDLRPVAAAVRQAGALRASAWGQAGGANTAAATEEEDEDANDGETFIAFARVFSGVLRPDHPLFVLGPRYEPREPGGARSGAVGQISLVTRPIPLFLMMGRDLTSLPAAYAGNVVGLGRVGGHVLKTATLCSTPACASLSPMTFQTTPLVRVAIEPVRPADLRALNRGLALLNQADPCVEVSVSESGEMQLAALGELHLQRCLNDLQTRFARVDCTVSPPILSFQETLCAPAKAQPMPAPVVAALTALQRSSGGQSASTTHGVPGQPLDCDGPGCIDPYAVFPLHAPGKGPPVPSCWVNNEALPTPGPVLHLPTGVVHATTTDRACTFRISARPLPMALTRHLEANGSLLRALAADAKRGMEGGSSVGQDASDDPSPVMTGFTSHLCRLAAAAGGEWGRLVARAWGFGPRGIGSCMLTSKMHPGALIRGLAPDLSEADMAAAVPAVEAALQSIWEAAGLGAALTPGTSSPSPSTPESTPLASLPSALPPGLLPALSSLRSAIMQGFGLAAGMGPLCGEPMWGVAFVLEGITLHVREGGDKEGVQPVVQLSSGSLMSSMRDGCRSAFEAGSPRLAEALYRCEVQCSGGRGGGGEALGKCYGVLAKRRARVMAEDIAEGTQTFLITALLPVVEAHGFADELRKRTSGAATSPQLLFSHWEVLVDSDPWAEGGREGEGGGVEAEDEGGQEGAGRSLARRFIDAVRSRKGLPLERKLVAHADKQRNLSRKK